MRARLLLVVLVVLAAVACTSTKQYDALPKPEGVEDVPTTSSTVRIDHSAPLPGVPGSTTVPPAAIGPGPVRIVGRVDGPDGPVAGARVRLERITDGGVAATEVPTAADGGWNADKVLGGRYRVRAWLPPTYGMVRAQVVFVEAPRSKPIILRLDRIEGFRVDTAIAPSPPIVGSPSNLTVRVTDRQVDAQGIIRAVPRVGVSVTLSGSGSWGVSTANPAYTDATGSATFEVTCGAIGAQPLSAILGTGETQPLDLPPCS